MHRTRHTTWAKGRVTVYLPMEIIACLERDADAEMVSLASVARRVILAHYRIQAPNEAKKELIA